MNKIVLLLLVFFCWKPTIVYAQFVSAETAQRVAENFFYVQYPFESSQKLLRQTFWSQDTPTMYAFSTSDKWVLIAADKRIQPILAYSNENGEDFYVEENDSPFLRYMTEWYSEQIKAVRNDSGTRAIDYRWDTYIDGTYQPISVIVPPLLKRNNTSVAWKQFGNNSASTATIKCYNKFCPPANCDTGNTVVGCAAVAAGQIMWYWQWPFARFSPSPNTICIYKWDQMPWGIYDVTPQEEADEIAKLLHDIGLAAHTNYGCHASGTQGDSVAYALQNTFNYLSSNVLYRTSYTNTAWLNMLKTELNNQRPVFYAGYTTNSANKSPLGLSGHAFVIDGYDSDNKFHINRGGGVVSDAYYTLDGMIYTINQSMIRNIQPANTSCSPLIIPTTDVWSNNFIIQHRGGIAIGDRIVPSNQHGVIISGNYVRFTSGFKVIPGASIYVACNDVGCDEREETDSANIDNEIIRNIPSKTTSLVTLQVQKILRDGQIFILRGDKVYTVTGQQVR